MFNLLEKWYKAMGEGFLRKSDSPRKGELLQGLDEVITTAKSDSPKVEKGDRTTQAFLEKLAEREDKLKAELDKDWDFRGDPIFSSAIQPANVLKHSMDKGEFQAFLRGILQGYMHADHFMKEVFWDKGEIAPYVLRTNRTEGLPANITGEKA